MYRHGLKRVLDFMAALLGLIVLSPILLITAIFVRIRLGSPVLFRQERPGLNEHPFHMFKFRSMTDARDSAGNLLPDRDRLPPVGAFLRKSSLDELPGLLNVLRGDMSLVGPRPLLMRYLPHYTAAERLRHTVRPGITGLAQVNGRNTVGWDQRLAYDVEYVQNLSLLLDCKIILKTAMRPFKGVVVVTDSIMQDLDVERRAKQEAKP